MVAGALLLLSVVQCGAQSLSCTSTVDNATVVMPDSVRVEGAAFFEPDSIAVVTPEGSCVGGGAWPSSSGVAVSVAGTGLFGDSGLDEKEPFRFRVYNARGEQHGGGTGTFVDCERLGTGVQVFCRDDGRYEDDAIYVLRTVRVGPASSNEGREIQALRLSAPYPNPTRGRLTVPFATPERQQVHLRLYDTLGRVVRTLGQGRLEGRQVMQADLSGLASGTYFLRLRSRGKTKTKRVTVVR